MSKITLISPLVLSLVDFGALAPSGLPTFALFGVPAIVAIVTFWYIGGRLASWVETQRISITANRSC